MADTIFEVSLIQNPVFEVVISLTGPPGPGVPPGGNAGDSLQKIDGTDFNTQWAPPGAVDVEAYLDSLPEWNSNEEATKPVIEGGGGLSPGDWYVAGPNHFGSYPGTPLKVQ